MGPLAYHPVTTMIRIDLYTGIRIILHALWSLWNHINHMYLEWLVKPLILQPAIQQCEICFEGSQSTLVVGGGASYCQSNCIQII